MENLLEMCGISAAFAATFAENMWSFLGFCWRQMGDLSNKKPRIMWVKQSYNKPSRSHHLIGGICLPFPGKWVVYGTVLPTRMGLTNKDGRPDFVVILHGTGGFHQRNWVAFPHGIQMYTVISANRYHCDFPRWFWGEIDKRDHLLSKSKEKRRRSPPEQGKHSGNEWNYTMLMFTLW